MLNKFKMLDKEDKKFIIGLSIMILIFVITLAFSLPRAIQIFKLKNSYKELYFGIDEVEIDFDDDKNDYDVFADGMHYYISRKQLETIIDTQDTYIVLLINEYSDSYNKAYLVLNVKQEELKNEN